MKRLQRLREEREWSKLESSRRSQISPSAYGQIESGRYVPYPVQLERIARAFDYAGEPAELLEEVSESAEPLEDVSTDARL